MRNQACEPCAKRKVRCDREEPCSNCKRRKQDQCTYPEISPTDKIKKLEALVRNLGGNPEDDDVALFNGRQQLIPPPTSISDGSLSRKRRLSPGAQDRRSKDPVILEEDGQQYYLESRAWLVHGHRESGSRPTHAKNPLLLRKAPDAFQSIICSTPSTNLKTASFLQDNAQTLWTTFWQRVDPLTRISFTWDLKRLQSLATASTSSLPLVNIEEDALLSSIYLASISSLSDVECRSKLHHPKAALLDDCQTLCEAALARTNILCMNNITALKAMSLYILVNLDRLGTQSLWTLMGLAIRNGEKLGIHRDGSLLGLSPAETEGRRRLWWQLQYLDLILAIRLGATPLTLMADWDVKLPLNIEDEDLTADMKDFPDERIGLTSMSYCMFTFYVLDQQRKYHSDKGQFELSWSTNQSVPMKTKETFIDKLERGLNNTFLQYCDPIKPLHVLLQLIARALTCVFRQRILLIDVENPGQVNHENRAPLLAASMQLIEYSVSIHSHRLLKDFQWLTGNGFPWPAFMVVLVEASHETDMDRCQRIWTLLSDLYAANTSLLELTEDRRRLHAAELLVAAWKTCRSKGTVDPALPKPDFVKNLESQLAEGQPKPTQITTANGTQEDNFNGAMGLETPQSLSMDQDANSLFDLDFQDIDWSFWNSIG